MHKAVNLIIGAGVTGLELASRLDDVTILTEDIGGLISNFECGAFSFDLGGHVYTTADERTKKLMVESNAVLHRERKTFYRTRDQQYVPYPVQNYPSRFGIDRYQPAKIDPANFDEYVDSIFGERFNSVFMRPFNRRVWSTPTNLMDFDWIHGRVKLPDENPEKWGMNASFYYAKGDDITASMMGRIRDVELVLGSLVHIDTGAKIVTYLIENKKTYKQIRYDNLFCTTPYFLPGLRRNRVLTIGVGLNRRVDEDWHWVYCDLRSFVHRITLLSRYHPGNAPEGKDSLLLEVPYIDSGVVENLPQQFAAAETKHDSERKKNLAVYALANAGFYFEPREIDTVFSMDTLGYPVPTLYSRSQVAATKHSLLYDDVYLAGRWGAHGYFNLQHIFQDVDSVMQQFGNKTRDVGNYLTSAFYYKRS